MMENIRIVLVATSHAGNIGAAARAMKTMGLDQLYLVQPRDFPSAEATSRASGADDVLAAARVCQDLEQAVADCSLVCGTSARLRRVAWPQLSPRECAAELIEAAARQPVALVFGRERTGLSNEELDRCHFLVNIPADPGYMSLNVASAVQILSYELRLACLQQQPVKPANMPAESAMATAEDLEGMYQHFAEALVEIDFLDADNPRQLMRRLRRLFNRARPDKMEVNILRGILKSAQQKARGK
jgi:TrmH family RNA methyltransferase